MSEEDDFERKKAKSRSHSPKKDSAGMVSMSEV